MFTILINFLLKEVNANMFENLTFPRLDVWCKKRDFYRFSLMIQQRYALTILFYYY